MPNEAAITPDSKSEILKAIGTTIAERRKDRGLTHEKVGQSLKIRPSFVKAIEEGDWQHLPGEVYARGFVTRYATLIGLNGKELLEPYIRLGVEGNPIKTSTSSGSTTSAEFPKSVFVWAGVALVVVVALIRVVISDHRSARQMSSAKEQEVKPAESAPANESAPSRTSESHTLQVFSPFPLWLSVKATNRSFEGFLPQGATWSWKGEGEFAVRIGHTQQVAMAFDGQPVTLGENQKHVSLPLLNPSQSSPARVSTQ